VAVYALFALATTLGRTSYTSPHLFGGTNKEKVVWEYTAGAAFSSALFGYGVVLDGPDA
jgi:hypothetical protein